MSAAIELLGYKPKNSLIADIVRKQIGNGKFRYGDKLLTDEEIAQKYNVNKRTVAAGLNALVKEGLLERAPRRGTIVVSDINKEHKTSNAVALVIQSKGDVYANIARHIAHKLVQHKLYPVLISDSVIHNSDHNGIASFLKCMNTSPFPYGYIVDGNTAFPYKYMLENPSDFNSCIFIIKYHYPEKIAFAKYVLIDLAEAGRMAARYFIEKGYKKLTCLAVKEADFKGAWSSMQVQIMEGFKEECLTANVTFDEDIFWCLLHGAPVAEIMLEYLRGPKKPDAFFAYSDFFICEQILPVLRKLHLSYPNDIEFIGFYNTQHSLDNNFSSIAINEIAVAENAFAMLTGQSTELKILIRPEMIIRI